MASSSSTGVPGSLRTNYARVGQAAQQLFPDILQELITIKEPAQRLSHDVHKNNYLSKKLRPDEWSMINNVVTKGYANFDIPFIYKLVRNLNLVPPPSKGWDYPTAPSPTEVTTGDDIERIRRFRNETLHRGNAQVTDTELSQYFKEFKNIAVRLETNLGKRRGEFKDKFVDLEICCMDEKISTIYIERLDRLKKSEEDCRKRLHAVEKDVDALKKRRNINSMDAENREIDKVKLPVSSVELVEVTKGADALRDNGIVILVGIQGSGKSTIGKAIIKQFCEVNTEYDIVELPTTEYPKESYFGGFGLFIQPRSRYKIVVFLDDLFGRIPTKYAFKEHLMLLKCVNERKDISVGLKILITVHSETKACLEELFASDTLLSTAEIINLPFGMYPRRNMLKAIGIDEKRSDNILRQMEETRVQERIGFPALVSILKGHPEFEDKLFTNPANVLMNYLSSLNNGNTHDKMYFVILIHVLMTGTVLEKHELLKDEIEKEKNSMCAISKILFGDELEFDKVSIETITDEKGITDEQGDGILVNKSDPHYSHYLFCFQQDVIRDFVFRSYKAKGVKEIITTCSLNCIVSYFRPSTDTAGEPFVCIDSSLYPTVASQIISIIQEDLNISVSDGINSVKTLCLSPLLQDKNFLEALMTECDQFKDVRSSIKKTGNHRLGYKTIKYLEEFHFTSLLLYQSCNQLSMMYKENVNIVKRILQATCDSVEENRTDSGKDNTTICETIHILVKSAMEEVCKENNHGNVVLEMLWKFIIDKKVDCIKTNFLINAWRNQCPQTVMWLQENVKEPNVLQMELCFLSICRSLGVDKASWIFKVNPNSAQNKLNMYKVFKIASERKGDCLVDVERIWQQWEERILEDYKHDEHLNESAVNVKKNFAIMIMNGIEEEKKFGSELFIWANKTFIPHETYFDKTMTKKIQRNNRDKYLT